MYNQKHINEKTLAFYQRLNLFPFCTNLLKNLISSNYKFKDLLGIILYYEIYYILKYIDTETDREFKWYLRKKLGNYHKEYLATFNRTFTIIFDTRERNAVQKNLKVHARLSLDWYKRLRAVKKRLATVDIKLYLYLSNRYSNKKDRGNYINEDTLLNRFKVDKRSIARSKIQLQQSFEALVNARLLITGYALENNLYVWTWIGIEKLPKVKNKTVKCKNQSAKCKNQSAKSFKFEP